MGVGWVSEKIIMLSLSSAFVVVAGITGCSGASSLTSAGASNGFQAPTGTQADSTPRATQSAVPVSAAALTYPATTIVQMIAPAVVRVDVSGPGFAASGSGVMVDARGYVITNHHVISGATQMVVTLMNGDSYNATVVGSESTRDLALLKLSANRSDFATVTLGTMADAVVGGDVLVAGFPLGTSLPGPVSFNKGIVSALRTYNGLSFVQTDAPVNPGNSGGCLVTMQGKVIGITVAGIVPPTIDAEGINLAIPINDVEAFIKKTLP